MNSILSEGLKAGDLKDLILPMISIDEFESKITPDAVVIAFFVDDKDPAQDLSNFMEKDISDLIDSDVSPAPNEEGYYLVFVEFMRDKYLPDNILSLISSVSLVANIDEWEFKPYKVDKIYPLTKENIEKLEKEIKDIENEINTLINTTEKQLWINELDDFIIQYKKWLVIKKEE